MTRFENGSIASGGDGAIAVFEQKDADHYTELGRINTVKGARTSYFSPDLDRFFLAVVVKARNPQRLKSLFRRNEFVP